MRNGVNYWAGRSVLLAFPVLLCHCAKYSALDINPVKTEAELRARPVPAKLDPDSLEAVAVENSGNVAVSRARLAAAEAAIVTARQRVNPSLSGEGGYNRTPDSVSTYSASLSYTIETGGKRALRTLAAQKNAEAMRIAVTEAEWQVRSNLRAALMKYDFAQKRLESAQAEAAVREEIVKIFEARLAQGEASRPETIAARAESASSEVSLKTAQGDLTLALNEIASAAGLPAASFEGRVFERNAFAQAPPEDRLPLAQVEKAGLLHRADIRRTLAEYEAADARLRLELANQYPNVTISPAYTFQEGFPAYTLGAALESLPVLHRHEGPIAEADAARREVRARFLALQAQVIGETETALRQYRAAAAELASVRDGVVAVQRQRESGVMAAFQAGETDRLDVAQTRLATVAAERAQLESSQKTGAALILLEDAVQARLTGGFSPGTAGK